MTLTKELLIDVASPLPGEAGSQVAATVYLPEAGSLPDNPIVCFAFPGGGYNRRYFALDLEDGDDAGQAGWHTDRGWIFVSIDHLGVGESSVFDPDILTLESIAQANLSAVKYILSGLADGSIHNDVGPLSNITTLAIGQSMGGCFLLVLQGQHHIFDGLGILGFSAIQTVVPTKPGTPQTVMPFVVRGSDLANPIITNAAAMAEAASNATAIADQEDLFSIGEEGQAHPWTWAFHFDDEPAELVAEDMAATAGGPQPYWRSPTTPVCAMLGISPNVVAPEAAAIQVPVLLATGERDVVPDPRAEPAAYKSAPHISTVETPRMSHMHNFANTRHQLWTHLHHWGQGVALTKEHG